MSNVIDLKKLAEPFEEKEIEWRVSRSGFSNNKAWCFVLAYMNARAVMDRLDEVVGPGNWKDRYWRDGNSIMCGLSIRIDGDWVEKVDGAEETDIEAVKGGLSGAMKRAAVKWGIGRYLYNLTENYGIIVDQKDKDAIYAKTKEGTVFYWKPPVLPDWAKPAVQPKAPVTQAPVANAPKPWEKPLPKPVAQPSNNMPGFENHSSPTIALFINTMKNCGTLSGLSRVWEEHNEFRKSLSKPDLDMAISVKDEMKGKLK